MKVALTGGGSAGHVTPNLSIIEQLQAKNHKAIYIGSYKGIERQMLSSNFTDSVSYFPIFSGKLRRYFSIQNFIDPFFVVIGLFQSILILLKQKPDLLFSKGGFVSTPVVIAAFLLRIPVSIHESDSTPGLATKITSKFASHIYVSDPKALTFFQKQNKQATLVELPIRKFLMKPKVENNGDKPRLLIMGGSLGAKTLNDFLKFNFDELAENYSITHLTGKGHSSSMPSNNNSYTKYEFVGDELADIYANTDIALCRAGATTLQELKQLKIPSILVPLPTSQSRGEQLLNSQEFAEKYPAVVIQDQDLNLDSFNKSIENLKSKQFKDQSRNESIMNFLLKR